MTRHSRKLTGTATQKLQPFHLKFNSTSWQTHWRHASNTSLFTGVICHLCINKETIGSKHRKLIRDVRRRQDVKRYIQKKANMDEGAFSEIDWNSHEQTVRSFQSGTRIFLVKFLHRWLPVGKHVSRYDPTKYRGNCRSHVMSPSKTSTTSLVVQTPNVRNGNPPSEPRSENVASTPKRTQPF
jgi:hypothetical protein